MDFIDSIKKPIQDELRMFQDTFSTVLRTDNPLLADIHEYILKQSGKQLRPLLTMLSGKLCGNVNMSTINAALSLELLHTASLMHDDVVDDTLERRGNASVNAHWNNKIAILSGDYMLSKSLSCASDTNNLDVLKAIAKIGMELADGELLQLRLASQSTISEEDYFKVIRKKTAYLFSTCAYVGGLSVDADALQLDHLKKYGEYLGMCFQIKDDIFDYSGAIEIGKPTGNDIREGKVTLPLIYALENAPKLEQEKIRQIISNKDFTTENVNAILQFVNHNNGVALAVTKMEEFMQLAITELSTFQDNEVKQALVYCAQFTASRNN